ncbi:MAG: sugar-transfer associated ATP-grasp domain-containing protein [Anaerovoracaceae bacterium]
MGLKKFVVNALALGPTSRGFTGGEARRWVREVYRHYTRDYGYSMKETRWAIKHGFMPEQVAQLGINEENVKDYISAKDYAYLRPLNGTYSKWITDKVTVHTVFKPFRSCMPAIYYQISKRYDEVMIIPLYDDKAGDTFEDVLALIREKGEVTIAPANGISASTIAYRDGSFLFDEEKMTEQKLIERMSEYRSTIVIKEKIRTGANVDHGVLNLIVFNEEGDNPVIGDGFFLYDEYELKPLKSLAQARADSLEEEDVDDNEKVREHRAKTVDVKNGTCGGNPVPYWEDIVKTLHDLCIFVPQLEFFGAEIVINEDGFKIMRMINHPEYPTCQPFSKETSQYLEHKVQQKKEAYAKEGTRIQRGWKKIKLKVRHRFARTFYPKGLVPYLSIKWIGQVWQDFRTNKDATFKEKMWAYRHGFLSYRIPQYGITEENYSEYISDFEYKWLRHINPKYRKWMEDKITVKYVCSEFNNCFPEYYYHIICKNGNNKVISMMDLPEGYTNTFDEIFRLVEEKGVLALKPDEGSHGDGFYKFTCENGKYQLNYEDVTRQQVLDILEDINNQYLVTEYINMHPVLKRVYDGSVNTVRMLVFKKDGKTPQVGNAYVRFGSKKTGAVDNVGAGGMTAHIDVETGRFYDAKIVMDGSIEDCPIHPDTGVPIEGYLPNWEQVKAQVLEVAASIKQLEFFGFDLAITEEGIKFPEINRFPDYPAVEKYTEKTRDYLLYKLEGKKRLYGYDVTPNKTLVHLPDRPPRKSAAAKD